MRITLTDYRSGRSAGEAHLALRQAIQAQDRAQHNAVLWFADIMARSLYRALGYSSINQYAEQALGFSRTRTGDFIRLAGKLNTLPAVRAAVANGSLGYTKAREIVKVATPRTEARWVAAAGDCSKRELAQKVATVRRKAARRGAAAQAELLPLRAASADDELAAEVPVQVALTMTPEQYARWEALWEAARKRGAVGEDRTEAMLQSLASWIESPGTSNGASPSREDRSAAGAPRGAPPLSLHLQQCPDCKQTTVATTRGELRLGRADAERVACDARVVAPDGRARSSIPPRIRRQVLSRDRHRCRAPGCRHTRFLEVHHIKPRERGGGHDIENLITLCAACHRLGHERGFGWLQVDNGRAARAGPR